MYVVITLILVFVRSVETVGLEGDITVAGVFQIYQSSFDKCGDTVVHSSVQHLEAIKWLFKKLNAAEYMPGVKLGLDVYKTCRVHELTASTAFEIVKKAENFHDNLCGTESKSPAVAVIGPEFSEEAEIMSAVFSSLPKNDRILQIAYSTTSSSLSDKEIYPNFYRVIQEDSIQVQVIVAMMQKLMWNYIAIIYEDDVYGRNAAVELKRVAKEHNICVPEVLAIPMTHSGAVSIDYLQRMIKNITISRTTRIGGVVFFGTGTTGNTLLLAIQAVSSLIEEAPAIIFSESVSLQKSKFMFDDQPIEVAKGSFIASPVKLDIPEFRQYWIELMQNEKDLIEESKSNPWLLDVYQSVSGCKLSENSPECLGLTSEEAENTYTDSLYIPYAVKAAYTIAKAVKLALNEECGDSYAGCTSMHKGLQTVDFIEVADDITVDFSADFPFVIETFAGSRQQFNENGNVEFELDVPLYEVYNYQDCGDSFCFQTVGQWKNGKITANVSKIRDYLDGIERIWPNIRKPQCPSGHQCPECVHVDLKSILYFEDGDVIVGALVPIYDKENDDLVACNGIRQAMGYELAESVSFVVRKANEAKFIFKDMFPNMKIGLVVVNSCNSVLLIQSRLLSLLEKGIPISGGGFVNVRKKLIGFIGELGSSLSIAAQGVLSKMKYVQISYASTNPSLSDRSLYPFFMRTTTPDNLQASVMMQIIEELGYNYIQIIHSVGSYGEGGKDAVKIMAEKHSVCVAQILAIEEKVDYTKVVDDLRKKAHAKVVIVFLRSHVVGGLMSTINEQMTEGEFQFIGSETWGDNPDHLHNSQTNYNLVGSITLALQMAQDTEYTSHLNSLWPGNQNDNPWLQPYMQKKKGCYFPLSFDKSPSRQCTENDRLANDDDFHQDIWTPFVMNSLIALLLGANKTFTDQCGHIDFLCDNFRKHPDVLVDNIKTVELDVQQNGQKVKVFNSNGDGNVGYQIYNIQRDTADHSKLKYINVGYSPLEGFFQLFTKLLKYPGGEPIESNCPNDKVCSECFSTVENEEEYTSDKDRMIQAFGGLFGVLLVTLITVILIFVVYVRRTNGKIRNLTKADYITPAAVESHHGYLGVDHERPFRSATPCVHNEAYKADEEVADDLERI